MPLEIGEQKQLLVDEYVVEDIWKVTRATSQAKKHERNPLIVGEQPWEGTGPYLHGSVLWDEDEACFKMWYQTFHSRNAEWTDYTYEAHYATSQDGITWHKPRLARYEIGGTKENNVFLRGYTRLGAPTILKEPRDPDPARRYKMVYLDAKPHEWDGICVAFSPDGLNWTPYEDNPVIHGHSDTHNNVLWDPALGKYVLFGRPNVYAGPWKRRIARSESEDFIHWTELETVFVPDEFDPPEFYGMTVFLYEGIYFGHLQVFDQEAGSIEDQLAFSRDGRNWRRTAARETFLPLGPAGSWDCGMIFHAAGPPPLVGDEMRFYYSGWDGPHHSYQRRAAIGLATLPRDRFIALEAGEQEGAVLTRPFIWRGEGLEFNAECLPGAGQTGCSAGTPRRGESQHPSQTGSPPSDAGSVEVAILSEKGEPIPGYDRSDFDRFTGDAVCHPASWRGSPHLTGLEGATVRLKFFLKHARLYAFQVR